MQQRNPIIQRLFDILKVEQLSPEKSAWVKQAIKTLETLKAAKEAEIKMYQELRKLDADFNVTLPDAVDLDQKHPESLNTLLIVAAKSGHREVVTQLIEAKASIDLQGLFSETPLISAIYSKHTAIAMDLIETKANPNIKDINGYTSLMRAVGRGIELCKKLIENKASLDEQNDEGNSALLIATTASHKDITQLLIEKRADVNIKNKKGHKALVAAASKGHLDIMNQLLEAKASPNLVDEVGDSALVFAVIYDHAEITKKLIDAKAACDTKNGQQLTPLILAAEINKYEIAKILIEAKASLDIQGENKTTALMHASGRGHKEIVIDLIKAKANIEIKNDFNNTALDYAIANKHNEIASLLLENGAQIKNINTLKTLFPPKDIASLSQTTQARIDQAEFEASINDIVKKTKVLHDATHANAFIKKLLERYTYLESQAIVFRSSLQSKSDVEIAASQAEQALIKKRLIENVIPAFIKQPIYFDGTVFFEAPGALSLREALIQALLNTLNAQKAAIELAYSLGVLAKNICFHPNSSMFKLDIQAAFDLQIECFYTLTTDPRSCNTPPHFVATSKIAQENLQALKSSKLSKKFEQPTKNLDEKLNLIAYRNYLNNKESMGVSKKQITLQLLAKTNILPAIYDLHNSFEGYKNYWGKPTVGRRLYLCARVCLADDKIAAAELPQQNSKELQVKALMYLQEHISLKSPVGKNDFHILSRWYLFLITKVKPKIFEAKDGSIDKQMFVLLQEDPDTFLIKSIDLYAKQVLDPAFEVKDITILKHRILRDMQNALGDSSWVKEHHCKAAALFREEKKQETPAGSSTGRIQKNIESKAPQKILQQAYHPLPSAPSHPDEPGALESTTPLGRRYLCAATASWDISTLGLI